MARKALGLDLGTTHSCVAVLENGLVKVIENELGNRTTPSVVSFSKADRVVGKIAKDREVTNAANTVYEVKRLLGRRFSDKEVQQDLEFWPFKVVQGQDDRPIVEVTYKNKVKQLNPEAISALVLNKLKLIAWRYLESDDVKDAVITVPAYFRNAQRQATKDAGEIAGLNVLQVLNEPTAAGIAYGLDKAEFSQNSRRKFLVFDWGGGTLDVSILQVFRGEFEVLAVKGDSHLGGVDFDRNLAAHFAQKFKDDYGIDVTSDKKAMKKLRVKAETAKEELSFTTETSVVVDSLHHDYDLDLTVGRKTFEYLNKDIFAKARNLVAECLKDAQLTKENLDRVVLVGGTSKIPKVAAMLKRDLGKEPSQSISPDEAIARGAALFAAVLSNGTTAAAPLPAHLQSLSLRDVAPLSLGIGKKGDKMAFAVRRNTPLPVLRESIMWTADDFQRTVDFPIYEGEHEKATENYQLGNLTLKDCLARPAGAVKFGCSFYVSAEGILTVKVRDRATGKTEEVTIRNGRLSREQINDMIRDVSERS